MKTKIQFLISLCLGSLVLLIFWGINSIHSIRGVMCPFLMIGVIPDAYWHAYVGISINIFLLLLTFSHNPLASRPIIWLAPIIIFLHGILITTWWLLHSFNGIYDWCVGGGHGGWRTILADSSINAGIACGFLMVSTIYTLGCVGILIIARMRNISAQQAVPPYAPQAARR